MRDSPPLEFDDTAFAEWIDTALAGCTDASVVAYCFNLYEEPTADTIELIGAADWDERDPDWACDAVWISAKPRFRAPGRREATWERSLARTVEALERYVDGSRSGAERLRRARAVAVGFIDGDLRTVRCASP